MKRKLKVVLEITVEDLPEGERRQCAAAQGDDPSALPTLADVEEMDLADIFNCSGPDLWVDFFAGSECYVQFAEVRPISAEWQGPAEA